MKTSLSSQDLQFQFQSADFVLKTQLQIAKDFYSSGAYFYESFQSTALPYEEIITSVNEKLEEVLKLGESATMQLLYQIDIPQKDFLDLTTDPKFILKMSNLIVRREAYKVFLRSKF